MQTESFIITLCTKKKLFFSLLRQPQLGEHVQSGINTIAVVIPFEHFYFYFQIRTLIPFLFFFSEIIAKKGSIIHRVCSIVF